MVVLLILFIPQIDMKCIGKNEHVNNILNFGSGDSVPDWTLNCEGRGKPGQTHSSYPKCVNWWCWNDGNGGIGVISTVLKGKGRGVLDYGLCYSISHGGSSSSRIVKVFLNGKLISSAVDGETSKVISFDFSDGSILKIQEESYSVFQFNNFTVITCY